jgi:uncharacterized protein (DUF433 family)
MSMQQQDVTMGAELIAKYIRVDPAAPRPERARIKDTGVTVAILVSYLRGSDWDVPRAASAYEIPEAAVQAALAFYRRHPERIDAWIVTNIAGVDDPILA